MSTEIQPGPMTVEEWLEYEVPEGYRAELVDGELVMTPLAEPTHQIILDRLGQQIAQFRLAHPGVIQFCSTPARFPIPGRPGQRGREPDLGIYNEGPRQLGPKLSWKDLHPVVVAEVVSPEQEARDYADKRRDYHLARIPEYWIVDFERRLFSALRWTEHGWNEHQIEGEGTYSTPLLPGLALDIGLLWALPRPTD
jgi:Uma2 family endonuclease